MNTAQKYKNPENSNDLLTRWLKRLRESQFAHNEAAKHFGQCHYRIGIPAAILSTIVGTSVFASLGKSVDPYWQIAVGLISVLAAVLSALQTILRYSERAERHRSMGARYGSVRRRIEEILATNNDESALRNEIKSIRQEIDELSEESPSFSEKLWERAKIQAENS